jgi:hypothetical protein
MLFKKIHLLFEMVADVLFHGAISNGNVGMHVKVNAPQQKASQPVSPPAKTPAGMESAKYIAGKGTESDPVSCIGW